ncbi:hypothetical protein EfsSVR2332_23860 [Enterococcus faecalis]|uniref:Uncharacterized protein n=1 Tax=Enterococcus faecalis TaxID=1351 RepID=A0AC59HRI8_ENTFL|nr:hypothetical protein EfsSVR2332_23860 [Enterococcus faecalis]
MASNEKTRYKAIIADHTYTIIGQESKQHMDLVTKNCQRTTGGN